jgi:hypothetical protein
VKEHDPWTLETVENMLDGMEGIDRISSCNDDLEVLLDMDPSNSSREVPTYLTLPKPAINSDQIQWWIVQKDRLPKLSQLALDYLAIPASSVPSERQNSKAGDTLQNRERLGDEMLKLEMCARSWLRVLDMAGRSLPKNIEKAFQECEDLDELSKQDVVVEYAMNYNQ